MVLALFDPSSDSAVDLEEAIRIRIDNELKELIHNTLAVSVKIGIRIFETAPRDSKVLMPVLERKKRELATIRDNIGTGPAPNPCSTID